MTRMEMPKSHSHFGAAVLVFGMVFCALYGSRADFFRCPDTLWHLEAGRLMLEKRALPTLNSWSLVESGHPWYNISWLYDAIAAAVFAFGGEILLVLMCSFVAALSPALAFLFCLQRGHSLFAALVSVFMTASGVVLGFVMRPQLVSFVLAVCLLKLLLKLEQARGTISLVSYLSLIALMAGWANCHGAFIITFVLLALLAGSALYQRDWSYLRNVGIAVVCAVLGCCLNPYGARIFEIAALSLFSVLHDVVLEWRPLLAVDDPVFYAVVGYLLLAMYYLGRKPRLSLLLRLAAPLWLVFSLRSQRNAFFLLIITGPLLAQFFDYELLRNRWRFISYWNERVLGYVRSRSFAIGGSVFIVMSVFIGGVTATAHGEKSPENLRFNGPKPRELLRRISLQYPSLRLYNHYDYGSLMIAEPGSLKPLWDGRAETAYSRDFLSDMRQIIRSEEGWERILALYSLDGMFIPRKSDWEAVVKGRKYWCFLMGDKVAAVYLYRRSCSDVSVGKP